MKMNFFAGRGPVYSLAIVISAFAGCQQEPDYKVIREEVIELHDQLMMDDEKVMRNKMRLDSLALSGLKELKGKEPALDTGQLHQEIEQLTTSMEAASDEMSTWMHEFEADIKGKTKPEAVAYFKGEKLKVNKLDSLYKKVLKESDALLNKYHISSSDRGESLHSHKGM